MCCDILMVPVAAWGLRLAMWADRAAANRSKVPGAVEYGAHSTKW